MIQLFLTRNDLSLLLAALNAKAPAPRIVKSAMGDHYPDQQADTIYISRRNITTLLSKLDRAKAGEATACTLVKNDTEHSTYPCTRRAALTAVEAHVPCMSGANIFAVEDDVYYTDRKPGPMHPKDARDEDSV